MFRENHLRRLLEGRRILIAGYGREGRSAGQIIGRLLPEAKPAIADGNAQIAEQAAKGYDLIIKSPGVPLSVLGGAANVSSLTDLFLQVYADRVVGVTGTKGKSTTASLVHHLLPGSLLAGNIGIPLFDIIDRLNADSVVVAELSCHQLEVLRHGPRVGMLLNLFEEYLDHYASYHDYKMAKMQLGMRQDANGHLFYCTDNDELASMVQTLRGSLPASLHPYSHCEVDPGEAEALRKLPLPGAHNHSNALVALRVARLVSGKSNEELGNLMASFKGLAHRLQPLGCYAGLQWFDDSISTIPAATLAALGSLGRVDTLIVGGMDRGIDYAPLADALRAGAVARVAFVGKAGSRVLALVGKPEFDYIVEDDYSAIVRWCADSTPRGGTVLLSPAAASYDAFRNFEHRGDYFRQQIENL